MPVAAAFIGLHGRELFLRAASAARSKAAEIRERAQNRDPKVRGPMRGYADRLIVEAEEYERLARGLRTEHANPQPSVCCPHCGRNVDGVHNLERGEYTCLGCGGAVRAV